MREIPWSFGPGSKQNKYEKVIEEERRGRKRNVGYFSDFKGVAETTIHQNDKGGR